MGRPTACGTGRGHRPRTHVPGAPFYAGDADRSTLRLCFVTQTPQEIAEGLRRLERGLKG